MGNSGMPLPPPGAPEEVEEVADVIDDVVVPVFVDAVVVGERTMSTASLEKGARFTAWVTSEYPGAEATIVYVPANNGALNEPPEVGTLTLLSVTEALVGETRPATTPVGVRSNSAYFELRTS